MSTRFIIYYVRYGNLSVFECTSNSLLIIKYRIASYRTTVSLYRKKKVFIGLSIFLYSKYCQKNDSQRDNMYWIIWSLHVSHHGMFNQVHIITFLFWRGSFCVPVICLAMVSRDVCLGWPSMNLITLPMLPLSRWHCGVFCAWIGDGGATDRSLSERRRDSYHLQWRALALATAAAAAAVV